jgi:hypothetical protein
VRQKRLMPTVILYGRWYDHTGNWRRGAIWP